MVRVLNFYEFNREFKGNEPFVVNTTSRSFEEWSRELSPFFLGPTSIPDGRESRNFENAWQYSKVYKEHLDKNGNPSNSWYFWSSQGFSREWADRYPMGKGAIPEYSFWRDNKLGYIEARKEIYIPEYKKAVKETKAFYKLKELYWQEGQLVLVDFDAYDHRKLRMDYQQVIENPNKKMGHAFVLAMMLEGND